MTAVKETPTAAGTGFLRFGLLQARVELVNRFTRWGAIGYLVTPAILFIVFAVIDFDQTVGTDVVLRILAGVTAAALFVGGFVGIAGELVTEQDDGTMLRVRTLPNGLRAYLVGKCASLLVTSVLTVMLILIPAQFLVGQILPMTVLGWLALLGVAVLALFSTVPVGAVAGSFAKSPLAVLPMSFIAYGVMLVSGIFFPLDLLPEWLGALSKVFPIYWLGLLSREVLLTGGEAVETIELVLAIAVPLVWAIVGLLLAPRALQAMTRRQSGARLEEVQQRRALRGY